MSRHESEMHRHRRQAIELLRRLQEWASVTGGWEAPVWRDVERFLAQFPPEPCDVGLFGDNRQLDLADRKDLKR